MNKRNDAESGRKLVRKRNPYLKELLSHLKEHWTHAARLATG